MASFWAGGRRAGPALSRLILLGCGVVAQCQPDSHEGMGSTGVDSVVVDNEMTNTTSSSIVIGGGNDDLLIRANHVLGSGAQGILFVRRSSIDSPYRARTSRFMRTTWVLRGWAGLSLPQTIWHIR